MLLLKPSHYMIYHNLLTSVTRFEKNTRYLQLERQNYRILPSIPHEKFSHLPMQC